VRRRELGTHQLNTMVFCDWPEPFRYAKLGRAIRTVAVWPTVYGLPLLCYLLCFALRLALGAVASARPRGANILMRR